MKIGILISSCRGFSASCPPIRPGLTPLVCRSAVRAFRKEDICSASVENQMLKKSGDFIALFKEFQALESLLDQLNALVDRYGYWAVGGAIFFEDFGMPLPGETLLMSAALLASRADMNIVLLLLFAWVGAVMGDNVGYAIGRFGGRRVVLRYGRFLLINKRRLAHAEGFFKRRGGSVVVVARFFEVLRQFNGLVAGIAEMPWLSFLFYNALGAALWVCFWCILFYEVGNKALVIVHLFHKLEGFLITALMAAGAIFVSYLLYCSHRRGRSGKNSGEAK